jgi:hypothetical protein
MGNSHACNRSPGSKLLSITTQLHCGGHLGGRAQLPNTNLEEDHPMTIPSKFGSNCATGSCLEPVAQLEPNFDEIVIGWSSSKIESGGPAL